MARILIADDVSMIRTTIRLFLEGSEHDIVAEADEGFMAVAMYNTYRPDVVLMDVSMPNLDGIEASRRILGKHPESNIIAMSFRADSELVMHLGRIGVRAFLVKPFTRVRLLQEIKRISPMVER